MAKILCIIDGMTDPAFDVRKYPALVSFPNMEYIQTVPDGFEAETVPCVLSLLGITSPPRNIRGWIEALGAGIHVNADDLIFRVSWVALDNDEVCVGFCDAPPHLNMLEETRYYPLDGYKGIWIVPEYASYIGSLREVLPFEMIGRPVSNFVNPDIPLLKDILRQIRRANPKRCMLPWAASVEQHLPNFPKKAAVVCGTNVVKGIAKALNMHLVTSDEMTGDTDTNLNIKLHAVLELAEAYPFVILHIGGCDEAAHRMDMSEKEAFLKKIDNTVLAALLASNHDVEVVSDHGTDPLTSKHIGGTQQKYYKNES